MSALLPLAKMCLALGRGYQAEAENLIAKADATPALREDMLLLAARLNHESLVHMRAAESLTEQAKAEASG